MNYWTQLHNTRANLALYYGQDLISCTQLPVSEAHQFFECNPYENWKKNRENQHKATSAIIGGLNNVIKGLIMLGKMLASRRR